MELESSGCLNFLKLMENQLKKSKEIINKKLLKETVTDEELTIAVAKCYSIQKALGTNKEWEFPDRNTFVEIINRLKLKLFHDWGDNAEFYMPDGTLVQFNFSLLKEKLNEMQEHLENIQVQILKNITLNNIKTVECGKW